MALLPRVDPGVVRKIRASLFLRGADAADRLLGRSDRLTPPRRLQHSVGDSDFRATGEEFLGHLRELAGLRETDRVLDIGCGIGRIARMLAHELRPPGSYDGFDIVPEAIGWCREHYRDTRVPFRFQLANLRNSAYNPDGETAAEEYRFPYPGDEFDLALATSVFTHLLPGAVDRYLAEAARVLRPGGRLFATWFVLDAAGAGPGAHFAFAYQLGSASVADLHVPEAAVAYPESWLRELIVAHGLKLVRPIIPGSWRGPAARTFQDLVVAEREP